MWIVGIDIAYYPSIEEYSTYEEAKERYERASATYKGEGAVYLAEVKEVAE